MKKMIVSLGALLISGLVSGCLFQFNLLPQIQPLEEIRITGKGKEKLLVMDLSGVIHEESRDGLLREPDLVSRMKEELIKAEEDPSIHGVILRINSPGGTVTASDILYHEIRRFKERTGKKVVASILSVGASGAYYVAMAADRVLAHPTAVTGSIGVIMLHLNVQGLMEKIGVGTDAITSGPFKDTGSPLKAMRPEERELLQGIIDGMYARFLDVIEQGRPNLSGARIRALADGRIYTADQALEAGLIDGIGYLDQAIDALKKEAELAEAQVVMYKRPHEFKNTIYSKSVPLLESAPWGIDPKSLLQVGSPRFLYLWMP